MPGSGTVADLLVALAVIAGAIVWATRGDANATENSSASFPSAKPAAPGDVVTTAGPVSKLDMEFLVKVRQANLWEAPAGRLAQTHATPPGVPPGAAPAGMLRRLSGPLPAIREYRRVGDRREVHPGPGG
ncbi:hypothetical protein [Streptomyces rapamycinicus]|uniref:Secreted protein n=2 Tax=Streptomyces rapamycinicus TaxID=1226757 RepID=A0A3L8R9X4_STRRN|nr:hypothetical protein [Streptomyces rapamycinicus]MBB4779587.1 hypothetical protein [Streptomyces rapamycinicus]RLV75753.1 secreted protein [Streptomyces rapamycinicus NRRL 5491]UTP28340.1 hypothetical protein LIV37_02630 [Streptomyces rapamycinicus NRRL 5491]